MMLTHDLLASSQESKTRNLATARLSTLPIDQMIVREDYNDSSPASGTKVFRGRSFQFKVRREVGSNVYWLRRPPTAILVNPSELPVFVKLITQWGDVRNALKVWGALRDDWDGDDAVAPTKIQIKAVEAFVSEAESHGIREPRPYIAPDGEIGFHWDGENKGTVTFLPSDRFLVFCPREGGDPLRIAGPLDIAACSTEMFKALSALR